MSTKTKIGIIGCGWLGFSLAEYFIKKGYLVNGSTTAPEKLAILEAAGITPFLIAFPEKITRLKTFLAVDVLIVNIPPGRRNPNVESDYPKAISTITDHIDPSTAILFVSSTSVYGGEKGWVKETTIRNPNTPSGRALIKIEDHLFDLPNKNKVSIIRPGGLVGGQRHPGRFMAGRKDIPNGDAPINLIHREDVIQCIYKIVAQDIWNETFNLSADQHPVKSEFYREVSQALKLEVPTFISGGADGKRISNEKIKSVLDLTLKYPDPLSFPD